MQCIARFACFCFDFPRGKSELAILRGTALRQIKPLGTPKPDRSASAKAGKRVPDAAAQCSGVEWHATVDEDGQYCFAVAL
jgi:hypothetical protein